MDQPGIVELLADPPQGTNLPDQDAISLAVTKEAPYNEIHASSNNVEQEDIRPATLEVVTSPTVDEDDDVQFVFSVPRRRKKKWKRIGSSHNGSSASQAYQDDVQAALSGSRPPPIEGMDVAKTIGIDGGDNGEKDIKVMTADKFVPQLKPTLILSTNFQQDASRADSIHSSPQSYTSYPDWMSWWQTQPLLSRQDAKYNWVPISSGSSSSYTSKRKWNGEHEVNRPCQSSQSLTARSLPRSDTLLGLSALDPLKWTGPGNGGMLDILNADTRLTTPESLSTPLSWHTHGLDVRPSSASYPPIVSPSPLRIGTANRDGVEKFAQSNFNSTQTNTSASSQESKCSLRSVRVPARLIPDESVSPRMKTVQVPETYNPSYRSPYEFRQSVPSVSPTSPFTSIVNATQARESQQPALLHTSQGSPPRTSSQIGLRPPATVVRQRQALNSDVLRRPSLYEIPPWPSSTNNVQGGFIEPSKDGKGYMINQSIRHGLQSRINNPSPGITSAPSSIIPPKRPLPDPMEPAVSTSSHGHRVPRKYPPNLIVDIAETCQKNFPFGMIAERHNQPIQKVYDTFSAIIQLPLLRHVDNRRHGSLGKRRMREFKDAKKAMEKAREEGRRKASREISRNDFFNVEPWRLHQKTKKQPDLLKSAVLNNAKEKK